MKLEDLRPQAIVRGILPDRAVTVVHVQWFGTDALELTYKDPGGRVGNILLYRDDEPRLELVEYGRPWGFDGDGALLFPGWFAHAVSYRLPYLETYYSHKQMTDNVLSDGGNKNGAK